MGRGGGSLGALGLANGDLESHKTSIIVGSAPQISWRLKQITFCRLDSENGARGTNEVYDPGQDSISTSTRSFLSTWLN